MFPETEHDISQRDELFILFLIPFPVLENLIFPVPRVCLQTMKSLRDIVSVKEVSIAENGNFIFAKDNIGMARETWPVFLITISFFIKRLAKD